MAYYHCLIDHELAGKLTALMSMVKIRIRNGFGQPFLEAA